jgi:hypothetical protein
MDTEARPSDGDLFYKDLIQSYVSAPRFVERPWLAERIEAKLTEPDCRFLLLTAEPGAGKTAFMAWLAHQHPDWCRYFIRRDQRTPLGDVGAHSFLLQVGFQLAAIHPDLFQQDQLKISVEQRIGTMGATSEAVGAEIDRLYASPFYQKVIQIQQEVDRNQGNVTGIRIGEWYADNRSHSIENLQYWALIDPAKAFNHGDPSQRIVVLVDALDELRYRDATQSLLKWLADCPELPANLRFILTSRPDDDLLNNFRGSQKPWLHEMAIKDEVFEEDFKVQEHLSTKVREDLSSYAASLVKMSEVATALNENIQVFDNFVEQIVNKANGNFGYLDAIGRAVDTAISNNQQDVLKEILNLSDLPDTLQELYAFFLGKIKDAVVKEMVPVKSIEGEIGFVPAWSYVYKPILGILSVAREPLTSTQIQKLGLIQAEFDYVTAALERLRQFLDQLGNAYRLYHSTLPEFFTSPQTKECTDYSYCYIDSSNQNLNIVNYYRGQADSWANVDLRKVVEDPYGRHHLTHHFIDANCEDELHALLALENSDAKNAWFSAKELLGDTSGFISDINLAWEQADKAFLKQPTKTVRLQCRYALITTSLNSLATKIPVGLLIALVQKKVWLPEQGLAYALKISEPEQKTKALTELADYLPLNLKMQALKMALVAAKGIEGGPNYSISTKAQTLRVLADKLPEDLFRDAFEVAKETHPEEYCADALSALADTLPLALLPEVLTVIKAFENEESQAKVLSAYAKKLSLELMPEACKIARDMKYDRNRLQVLSALLSKVHELLQETLNKIEDIEFGYDHARLLSNIANQLPPDLLPGVLQEIKDEFHKGTRAYAKALICISNKIPKLLPEALDSMKKPFRDGDFNFDFDSRERAKMLRELIAKIPPELLLETFSTIRTSQDDVYRTLVLEGIADKLPLASLSEALSVISEIRTEEYRAQGLCSLSSKLPHDLLPEALAIARGILDKLYCTKALSALTEQFPELLPETLTVAKKALSAVSKIEGDWYGVQPLCRLASSIPFSLLPDALSIAKKIRDQSCRHQALDALASRLTPELLREALSAIGSLADEEDVDNKYGFSRDYAHALEITASHSQDLPSDLLSQLHDQNASHRESLLSQLTCNYPHPYPTVEEQNQVSEEKLLLRQTLDPYIAIEERNKVLAERFPEVLSTTREIENPDQRVVALIKLAEVSPDLWAEIIRDLRTIHSEVSLADIIKAIADIIPQEFSSEILDLAMTIKHKEFRGGTLGYLSIFLSQIPTVELYPIWLNTIHQLASRTRIGLLQDIMALYPIISILGGPAVAAEIVTAIRDVKRWWP